MPKKANFFMEKTGDHLEFCGAHQKTICHSWIKAQPQKQIVKATLERQLHPKTDPQLGYYHVSLLPFAVQSLIEAGYDRLTITVGDLSYEVKTDEDSVDDLLKNAFSRYLGLKKKLRKRDMTVDQMGEYIDYIIRWCAENYGAVAPPPERNQP